MTGYSGEFIRADMLTPGVSFIQKPFTPADLGRKIRKLLTDPREAAGDSAVVRQQADKGRKAALSVSLRMTGGYGHILPTSCKRLFDKQVTPFRIAFAGAESKLSDVLETGFAIMSRGIWAAGLGGSNV